MGGPHSKEYSMLGFKLGSPYFGKLLLDPVHDQTPSWPRYTAHSCTVLAELPYTKPYRIVSISTGCAC